jgi:tRNA A-37 threonylcarbamoyl transferase component Bud32
VVLVKPDPGTVIAAKYRLDRVLGQGGMGVVWAAERLDTGEKVAIKLLKEDDDDAEARRRFLREGRAAQAVQHPHVVTILEVIELEDGAPAIVMERLEGESLDAKLRRDHRIGLAELAHILVPVISAVGTAHAAGVIHRDLKPANIFLCRAVGDACVPKVLDFGIAKLTTLDDAAMRSTGITTTAVLGTPAYMAPEQVFGESDLDHGADVWALGLILYHCLSGVLPTKAENIGQVLKNVLAKPFDPLDQLVPEVPEDVSRLVARMLDRDRDGRPADLREVLGVLERYATSTAPAFGPPSGRPRRSPAALKKAPDAHAGFLARVERDRAPRGRRMHRVVAAISLVGALVGTSLLVQWLRDPRLRTPHEGATEVRPLPGTQAMTASPLADPSTTIACPVLDASGVDPPAGWLGAAAAAVACERARVVLGGRPERTLVPAELLDLPREPVDSFPKDPYGNPDARELSLAAARNRAAAYLDGRVVKQGSEFLVVLELHRADRTEISRAQGSGAALYAAVRVAMDPLVGPAMILEAGALDPHIAAWSGTHEVDAALGLLDLTFAFAHNAGGLTDECDRFKRSTSAKVGNLGLAGLSQCAHDVGRHTPEIVLEGRDGSPEAVAMRIHLRQVLTYRSEPGDADFLHRLWEHESTSWGRSLAAVTESCVIQPSDPKRASNMALAAVQAEPKNPDGLSCNPWGQLVTLADTAVAESSARAMQAWMPWSDISWFAQGQADRDPTRALIPLRRAYVLAPFNTQVAEALADKLLVAGDHGGARAVAVAVSSGGYPVHKLESDLLLLRVAASEARFGAALRLAQSAMEISSGDAGWVLAQRFEAAWRALELARILGRTNEIADLVVQRFIDPEPPVLDPSAFLVPRRIPVICAAASATVAVRCFARFRVIRGQLSGGITQETDELLRGSEFYTKRDFLAAARAWRPLLRGSNVLVSVLPEAMADTFERSGDFVLAEQVDRAEMSRAPEFNGATLAHVRTARRAQRHGDFAVARTLAKQVVDAWSVADEEVPAATDMRQLLLR